MLTLAALLLHLVLWASSPVALLTSASPTEHVPLLTTASIQRLLGA